MKLMIRVEITIIVIKSKKMILKIMAKNHQIIKVWIKTRIISKESSSVELTTTAKNWWHFRKRIVTQYK